MYKLYYLELLSVGVSLLLSETEISVNESEEWYISCIGDGNPMPTISCISENNNSAVGEQKTNMTSINIVHANCMDTGLYTCFGNNSIGEPVSTSADIKVACKCFFTNVMRVCYFKIKQSMHSTKST